MTFSRSTTINWQGSIMEGSGKLDAGTGAFSMNVTFPKRIGEPEGSTSPEELIAAAHSSCYAMQLSAFIAEAGGTPQPLDVTAKVSLGPDPAGGFALTGIAITVRAEVDGLDAAGFEKAAQAAKDGCR